MSDPSYTKIINDGLWHNNAGLVQLLGLCPLLAITTAAINGLGTRLRLAIRPPGARTCRRPTRPGLRGLRARREPPPAPRNLQTNKVISAPFAVPRYVAAPAHSETSGIKSSFFQPNKSTVIWQATSFTPASTHNSRNS